MNWLQRWFGRSEPENNPATLSFEGLMNHPRVVPRLSQELRTPLANMAGFIQILQEQAKADQLPETYTKTLQRLSNNHRVLVETIDNLLYFGQSKPLSVIPTSPLELVEQARHHVGSLDPTRISDIRIQNQLEKDLKFYMEPQIVQQILVNLLNNALKFTKPKEAPQVTVVIDGPEPLRFAVQDKGLGISKADFEQIFMPFFRSERSMTRRLSGLGLGLTVARSLATKIGGTLSVQSELGRGSEFSFTLPAKWERQTLPMATPQPIQTKQQPLQGKHILIVEDSDDLRELLSYRLATQGGAFAMQASNGQQALDLLAHHPNIDCILMDMQMPVLNGFETLRIIRNQKIQIPVIALTAHSSDFDKRQSLDAGATDYLTKPIDWTRLYNSLSSHMSVSLPEQ